MSAIYLTRKEFANNNSGKYAALSIMALRMCLLIATIKGGYLLEGGKWFAFRRPQTSIKNIIQVKLYVHEE